MILSFVSKQDLELPLEIFVFYRGGQLQENRPIPPFQHDAFMVCFRWIGRWGSSTLLQVPLFGILYWNIDIVNAFSYRNIFNFYERLLKQRAQCLIQRFTPNDSNTLNSFWKDKFAGHRVVCGPIVSKVFRTEDNYVCWTFWHTSNRNF